MLCLRGSCPQQPWAGSVPLLTAWPAPWLAQLRSPSCSPQLSLAPLAAENVEELRRLSRVQNPAPKMPSPRWTPVPRPRGLQTSGSSAPALVTASQKRGRVLSAWGLLPSVPSVRDGGVLRLSPRFLRHMGLRVQDSCSSCGQGTQGEHPGEAGGQGVLSWMGAALESSPGKVGSSGPLGPARCHRAALPLPPLLGWFWGADGQLQGWGKC